MFLGNEQLMGSGQPWVVGKSNASVTSRARLPVYPLFSDRCLSLKLYAAVRCAYGIR